MKKYFILMASAALMLAVSCNKEEVNTPQTSNETELITVQINPETKTSLNGLETVWSEKDKISVTVDGENIGELEYTGSDNKFSGNVTAGKTGAAILNYPAGVTEVPAEQEAVGGSFANGAALLVGETTMEALRAGEGATLSNKTALLQFTVAQAGDVTFEVGENEYTVTGCQTDATYYACVAPANSVKLSYTVSNAPGAKEKANFSPVANEIYKLGELATLVKSTWAVVGNVAKFGTWDAANSQYYFYETDDFYVAKNVPFAATDEFKFVNGGSWYRVSTFKTGEWMNLVEGGDNLKVSAASYDFYILKNKNQIYATSAGSPVPEKPAANPAKDSYLYLNPSMWAVDGARFAAYFFGNDEIWISMTDPDGDGIYEVEKPSGYTSVIFCRMNGSTSDNNWDNKWNQSGDLTIPTNGNNLFTPSDWNNATTTWETVTEF